MLHLVPPKQRRFRFGRILPPPVSSTCMYVQIAPRDVAMFKFLLEAEDNLGYMSVVDRWSAALKVVFSPHQEREMRGWLKDAATKLDFKEIWPNRPGQPWLHNDEQASASRPKLTVITNRKGL